MLPCLLGEHQLRGGLSGEALKDTWLVSNDTQWQVELANAIEKARVAAAGAGQARIAAADEEAAKEAEAQSTSRLSLRLSVKKDGPASFTAANARSEAALATLPIDLLEFAVRHIMTLEQQFQADALTPE